MLSISEMTATEIIAIQQGQARGLDRDMEPMDHVEDDVRADADDIIETC